MAKSRNTIVGKSYLNIRSQIKATAVAITPGALLERTSGGLVQVHSTEGGTAESLFAIEDAHQGKKISDDYAVSAPIMCQKFVPGERVYALIDQTSGVSIAIGDYLISHGDGTLTKLDQASAGVAELPGSVVAVALEAAVAGTDTRALVEIV